MLFQAFEEPVTKDKDFLSDKKYIIQEKAKTAQTIRLLRNDIIRQKDSIQTRVAERTKNKRIRMGSLLPDLKLNNLKYRHSILIESTPLTLRLPNNFEPIF